MGEYVAPVGIFTVSWFAVAEVATTVVAPKITTLLVGVVLKFVPVMVTSVPTGPLAGVKPVMVGACPYKF